MKNKFEKNVWGVLRILMGFTFLWPFFDKMFGLGFATCRDAKTLIVSAGCAKAWLNGGSPTEGFLKFGTRGPLSEFYQGLAGNTAVEYLFMLGLLLIGLALIFGIGVRIASISGIAMFLLMYSAALMPENNPVLDDHIIYSVVLFGFFVVGAGDYLGFGLRWSKTKLVQRFSFLR